jgi:4-amino-4-deoxy-L-arabinose transferase-like glycosyltransferase
MNRVNNAAVSSEIRWLFLIVAAGVSIRLAAIAVFEHKPYSDELAYLSMALNLVNGSGIIDSMGNRAMYNMGYPFLVLAPVFAMFGENLYAARVVNALLGGLAIVLCYALAREAGAGKSGRLLAAALWAIYLPSSVYAVYLAKENLMIPMMLGVIWCALRLLKSPSYKTAVGCGLLFGLLALTGNAALSLVGAVMVALMLTPCGLMTKVSLSLVVILCAMLVASPWMIRNTRVLGAPVLNTNGGFNLYLGNNPAATGMFVSIADTPRGKTWDALRQEGEIQASETLKAEAIAWIKDHPSEFITLASRKAAYFWTPPFHTGKGESSRAEAAVRLMWAIQFVLLIAGAIASLFIANLRTRSMLILWLAIAGYTAVHMLFYVIFRYREPMMPLLCVMAGLTLESVYLKVSAKRMYLAAL